MHIFLTGNVQVGKSTVVDRVVSALNLPVGGFRTAFDERRGQTDRWLYMWDAAEAPAKNENHGVVRFGEDGKQVFTDRFNAIGGGALRRARENGAGLILMDECGRFEGGAEELQQEIFAALAGDIPVLGVVRQGYHGWLDDIRSHPKVTVLTVTTENRETLHEQIVPLLLQP